jgi:signal transduction histidine kinase
MIRRRLALAGTVASCLALITAAVLFAAYDRQVAREEMAEGLSALAEILAANSTAAVSFGDTDAARELLGSLRLKPDLRGAAILTTGNAVLAQWGNLDNPGHGVAAPGFKFAAGHLRAVHPITVQGERIGSLIVEADTRELDQRLGWLTRTLAIGLVWCAGTTYLLANKLHGRIVAPVLDLAALARQVTGQRNFGLRARGGAGDEVGVLVRAFNEMLEEIEARDRRLNEQNHALEAEIAERRRAEADLSRLAGQLALSNRELQDFAYVASHDLQEPLRKVQAFGDRLAARWGTTLGPDGVDYLERMRSAARRMQALIADLLAFSRVTTRGQAFTSVDLAVVVKEVLQDLEVRCDEARAALHVGPLPTLDGDPMQMRQLVQNLVGNALKFVRPDVKPRIEIGAEPAEIGGRAAARVWFRDNGVGFDPRHADRIFAIFQRLHTRQQFEGTGVGLAICRRIVERHGGSIRADGRVGEGATFEVVLPLRQPTTGA